MNQAYKTAGQAYRVIDDDSFGVIVPYKKGLELIEALQTSYDMTEIKKYLRQAQRYTVNIRVSQVKKLFEWGWGEFTYENAKNMAEDCLNRGYNVKYMEYCRFWRK